MGAEKPANAVDLRCDEGDKGNNDDYIHVLKYLI